MIVNNLLTKRVTTEGTNPKFVWRLYIYIIVFFKQLTKLLIDKVT
jgi:hypothetical protein